MLDFNQGYTARAAIQAARHLQDSELLWLEEPVGPEDVAGYRGVAQTAPVAVAGGEALASLAGFVERSSRDGLRRAGAIS